MGAYSPVDKAISIIPHFTAAVSIYGSSRIVFGVLSDRSKLSQLYHRILLCLSTADFLALLGFFLSTWPIPKDAKVFGSSGTTASCTVQGTLTMLSVVPPLYNTSLAVYYYLVVVRGWSEKQIAKLVGKSMLALPFVFGLVTCTAGLFLKLFNNATLWCWIVPYPSGCTESYRGQNPSGSQTCTRGDNATIYRYAFYYGPLWLAIIIVTGKL